ncbi:MAG: patatin family protein [Oscillospiraceae bacterium]|nr:patatin family protein [Oscillospiraceae bacterium]
MKIGLVLEGGACRSVFSAGVLDALMDAGIKADYVIGVSAGACYMASYCSGQRGRNYKIMKEYIPDKRYMGVRYLLNPENRSYFNLNFVYNEIVNELVPFDYEALEDFPGRIVAVVTNIESGNAEYIDVPRNDKKSVLLRASCALPILFPPIKFKGQYYMDGGIVDPIPIEHTLAAGCDKVIVIVTRDRNYIKMPEPGLEFGKRKYRRYQEFVRSLDERTMRYNGALSRMKKREKEGKAFVIAPKDSSRYKRIERDSMELTSWYMDGFNIANERLDELKAFLEG